MAQRHRALRVLETCFHAVTRALAAVLAFATAQALACGDSLQGERRSVEGDRYVVAFVTLPARIVVGEHFVVDFAVCPRAGVPAPASVRVDGHMPEHRHGMNYRAVVTRAAPGVYRAEGLLFHMRGHWEITFDAVDGSRVDRLAMRMDVP